jgi:hypothetical protein
VTDNDKKIDEDLQRAAEQFLAAKISQGYSPDHATALLHQRFHQMREVIVKDRRKALRVVDDA